MLPLFIGIGAALLGAATIVGIIHIVLLTYKKIKKWFQKKHELTDQDKNNVEATVKLAIADGNTPIVQGIFNKKTGELVDGQRYDAERLDYELEAKHKGKDIAIYNM
jgi:hypothetical protein